MAASEPKPPFTRVPGTATQRCPACGAEAFLTHREWRIGVVVVSDYGVECGTCSYKVEPPASLR